MDITCIPTHKGFMKNYVYLCVNQELHESFIIDPSWEINKIYQALNDTSSDLKAIILTHSHFDHVSLVDDLTDKFNIPVYINQTEAEYYKYKCKNMITIKKNSSIYICGTTIHTITTPGHTKGSMCMHFDSNFFTGDTLLIEGCTIFDEDGGNTTELYNSLKYLFSFIKDEWLIYPGHANKNKPGLPMSELRKINKCSDLKSQNELDDLLEWKNALGNIR